MVQRELYGPREAVWSHKHSRCEKSQTLTLVARQGMRISLLLSLNLSPIHEKRHLKCANFDIFKRFCEESSSWPTK